MAEPQPHRPVLLLLAAFSRHPSALDWARERAVEAWGEVALESERFSFDWTTYYEASMGTGISKRFLAFDRLIDPAQLAEIKLLTNRWEAEYRQSTDHEESRPLNLDPGYLTEAKLVLATTKDRDHRLYLDRGIFAEGTLYFHKGRWQSRPWTYPDYQSDEYHRFFDQCRQFLRTAYRSAT